jgi:hypothetical protein
LGEPVPNARVTLEGASDLVRAAREGGLIDRGSTDIWAMNEHFRLHLCNDFDIHFETDDGPLADQLEGFLLGHVQQVVRHVR